MQHAALSPNAFDWVDDYFAHIRPHFDVREEDRLLLVLPNRAVKLNRSGLSILRYLKDGGSIRPMLDRIGEAPQRRSELLYFQFDFSTLISGCLGEGRGRKAVQVVSHGESFNTLPVLSEIAVTYRCNLRCTFCYAACGCHGGDHAGGPAECSTAEIIRLLEVIRHDAKVPSVSFTGGEPSLRDDLEELVAAAGRIGLRTNLITNARGLTMPCGTDSRGGLASAGFAGSAPR